jgi:hypothetical protein
VRWLTLKTLSTWSEDFKPSLHSKTLSSTTPPRKKEGRKEKREGGREEVREE